MSYRIVLKNGHTIQTSDEYSGPRVLIGCTRDGKHIYKAKKKKDVPLEDLDWKEIKPKLTQSGFANGESHTHKKSCYYKVSVPCGGLKAVHQVVASCWLVKPQDGEEYWVHHKNHCPYENGADNLEYVTPKQHGKLHSKKIKGE